MKRHSPSADRNKAPILDVLRRVLPDRGLVLEIASGSGQHVLHFAAALPHLTFQPTDPTAEARASISEYAADSALPNLLTPLLLDAAAPDWPVPSAAAIVCINMIHISPPSSTTGLFAGASRLLPSGAPLFLYGPYRFDGAFTAPSNEAFDASLRAQDPTWGVRDVTDLKSLATDSGFTLDEIVPMPANNHSLIFRRR